VDDGPQEAGNGHEQQEGAGWLHGTLRRDVPQGAITIGVAELQEQAQVTLAMPFVEQQDSGRGGRP
jgi:hypothetical protein